MTDQHYFERVGESAFRSTAHAGGAWDPAEQHVGPSLGLLAHLAESDVRERRGGDLRLVRAGYDILGTYPLGEVVGAVRVVRPGRTIELVEARLSSEGRDVVVLRAWFGAVYDTTALRGSRFNPPAGPASAVLWEPEDLWPGGFVRSVEVRRSADGPGRATAWIRPRVALLAGEEVSATSRALGAVDIANGLTPLVSTDVAAYPNLDLTAHLVREPTGEWLGLDTSVSVGPDGAGLTHSVLHDTAGPLGSVAQILTVRPRPPRPEG